MFKVPILKGQTHICGERSSVQEFRECEAPAELDLLTDPARPEPRTPSRTDFRRHDQALHPILNSVQS